MTSVATGTGTTSTASSLVGRRGIGLFGSKNPKWYACVVKMDNCDGTIKVQWDEDKKYTKRLPEAKFKLMDGDAAVDDPINDAVPHDIFAALDQGDY